MHTHTDNDHSNQTSDPLGLGALPLLEPDRDGWPEIRAALQAGHDAPAQNWRRPLTWLAAAASVVLALTLVMRQVEPPAEAVTTQTLETAQQTGSEAQEPVESLIAMSQSLESQLRQLRDGTVSMPANSAVYVAELEDLVAQVDHQLSYSPDSVNLWGQRINLLLDLAQIYQQQWQRDYGLMASL